MEIRYHPLFERWLIELADANEEVFGEVMALLTALEVHGRSLDDETQEAHPVVTSRYDMHALRRTPPSETAPYATQPPIVRMLYSYCTDSAGEEVAVVLLGGDKTRLGNLWYPPNINEAQHRLDHYCRRQTDLDPIVKRGDR
ncbi:MAG: hypothetical protein M3Z84_01005 [Actinomycetota bacterium]|nr:hypothetical protein [Actinomycetota bacterium]